MNYLYGVSEAGQLQQIYKNPSNNTATVTNIGTALGGTNFNGLGISSDGTSVYGFRRVGNTGTAGGNYAKLYTYSVATGTWSAVTSNTWDANLGGSGVAGAVAPDGKYYFGLFNSNTTFRLWVYDGSSVSEVGSIALGVNSANGNGDIAFDSVGNLYITRGVNNGTALEIFRVLNTTLESPSNMTATRIYNGNASFNSVNGIAYDASGRLYFGGSSGFGYVTLPTPGTPQTVTLSGLSSTDLASCSYPPTIKLQKNLPNGRAQADDRFGLELREGGTVSGGTITGGTSLGTATAQSPASGVQTQMVGPVPITSGTTVTFAETFTNGALSANYASGWQCTYEGGTVDSPETIVVGSGAGTAGSITIPTMDAGHEITCEFVNSILTATKTANPVTGTAVSENQVVEYTLSFDNTAGLGPAVVNYRDFLADVLDDAVFVTDTGDAVTPQKPYVVTANGITYTEATDWNATLQWITVAGTVPAGQIGTLKLWVKVLPNDVNTTDRQEATATQGFFLRNTLAKGAPSSPPATCVAGLCTEHPIAAWTIRKDSQPEDGAMIHVGGNIYYRVKVSNLGGQTISGVQISDDMTQTLAATLWDPTAPPAVTVPYGISYYTANGTHIAGADIVWNAATGPKPVFSGDPTFDPDFPDERPFPGGTWTFTTPLFDVPATIGGQEVAYAIVGYAVKGGQVASPTDPTQQYLADGTTPVAALSNAMWINTASAGPATIDGVEVAPSRCAAPVPVGDVPGYYDCKTWHSLGESYFHLWKKSANEGTSGSGQNLTGSVFVLADTPTDAMQGIASRWLCRTDYAVPDPEDAQSDPDYLTGTVTGNANLDIGKGSATHQSIQRANQVRNAYNITHGLNSGDPGYRPQLEQCGLFFELQGPGLDQGQEPGSWRAMDVRGGDTVAGSSDPLPKWRTESGYNNGTDDTGGIHGTYWVAEMKSPVSHQLLASPFKLWVAPSSPTPSGTGLIPGQVNWYNYQGRLSLPYVGEGEAEPQVPPGTPAMGVTDDGLKVRPRCVDAWQLPANNQPNCVMPTGWTMPIFDVKAPALPLTGGQLLGVLTGGGAVLLLLAFGGTIWWRRRQAAMGVPGNEPAIAGGDSL